METKILYKTIKNPILKVMPNLEVILSMPLDASQKEIEYILEKRKKWITQKLDFFKSKQIPSKLLVSGEDFFYLGKRYRLKIIKDVKTKIVLNGKYLQIYINDTKDYKKKEMMIQKWYQNKARNIFSEILLRYSKMLEINFKTFSVRTMKTRWGSCKINKAHITLNLELIKKPKKAIEYVILHELAHLKYPYHNQAFYNFLDLYMPDWKKIKTKVLEEI